MGAILCRVIYIPSAIALIALVVMFGRQPLEVPPIGEMTPFTTEDKMLTMQHPANWKPHSNAVAGSATELWFIPMRNAEINVKGDSAGSFMADATKGPSLDLGNTPGGEALQKASQKRPLISLHEMRGEEFKKLYDEYDESRSEETTLDGMDALSTHFTYKRSAIWGKKEMSGRRLTAIGTNQRITVFYVYPKELEDKLEPVFKKMLATFKYTSI